MTQQDLTRVDVWVIEASALDVSVQRQRQHTGAGRIAGMQRDADAARLGAVITVLGRDDDAERASRCLPSVTPASERSPVSC